MSQRLVLLDRDGVINFDSPDYIKSPDEWKPIPGSLEAIKLMHETGFLIYVATNQAGIARGKYTESTLAAIHRKMLGAVGEVGGVIAGIEHCPHHPDDGCACRKPEPGMLRAIEESSGISIAGQPFVGDSLTDIRAAEAAGCEPILVLTGNGRDTLRLRPSTTNVYENLLAFAMHIAT